MRWDLASEAIWRPKQPQIICLKNPDVCNLLTTNQISTGCSLSSNNKLKLIPWSNRTWKIIPPMAAAVLLGPELVTHLSHTSTEEGTVRKSKTASEEEACRGQRRYLRHHGQQVWLLPGLQSHSIWASLTWEKLPFEKRAFYLSQDFVMFFHLSCEGLPGQ